MTEEAEPAEVVAVASKSEVNAGENEIDLYGDAEGFEPLGDGEESAETNASSTGKNDAAEDQQIDNDDLYDAVITEHSCPSGAEPQTNLLPGSGAAAGSLASAGAGSYVSTSLHQKKYSCYVGNLTWWTTDQDLADLIAGANIADLLDVKFYENRANGQSKGFALVSFGSDVSVRQCMDRLSSRQLHGQTPVVMPYNKQSLNQFEAATRKPGDKAPPKPAYTEKQGSPMFLGTVRIGTGGPSSTGPIGPMLGAQGPMRNGSRPVVYHPTPQGMAAGGMPLPGTMILPGGRHPRNSVPPGTVPPGTSPVVVPPPTPNRPPPGFPPTMRPVGPPPAPGLPPPGVPPPGSHVNPNFYPGLVSAATAHGSPSSVGEHQLSEAEFEEIMNRNRTVSSSAISRAVSDAAAGDFASAIETLVTAISLIRQSKVSYDDRCKILISSLQDTLHGIEAKSYGRRSKDRSRDRSRSRERRSKRRDRSRTRSRSRERYLSDYSPRRRRY